MHRERDQISKHAFIASFFVFVRLIFRVTLDLPLRAGFFSTIFWLIASSRLRLQKKRH